MPDNNVDTARREDTLHVLPVQVVETADGVLLIRGTRQVRLTGSGVFDVLFEVLGQLQPPGRSRRELLGTLAGPERAKLDHLLDLLITRGLVVSDGGGSVEPTAEGPEDIFFWDFGLTASEIRASFSQTRIHLIGVNRMSLALVKALRESGFSDLSVVDTPMLRNLALFDETGIYRPEATDGQLPLPVADGTWRSHIDKDVDARPSVIIASSDFGGKALLRPWNEMAVSLGVAFFPVVLQQLVGSIGPYVVPYETPCYECVRGRENSNMDDPAAQRELESLAFEGQFANGYHPLMPGIVAGHAAFELTKMFSGIGRGPTGRLITVSPLDGEVAVHRVLRLPYCPVCGSDARHSRPALGDIAG